MISTSRPYLGENGSRIVQLCYAHARLLLLWGSNSWKEWIKWVYAYHKRSGVGSSGGGTTHHAQGDRLLEKPRVIGWRRRRLRRLPPLLLRGDGDGRRNRRQNHSKLSFSTTTSYSLSKTQREPLQRDWSDYLLFTIQIIYDGYMYIKSQNIASLSLLIQDSIH